MFSNRWDRYVSAEQGHLKWCQSSWTKTFSEVSMQTKIPGLMFIESFKQNYHFDGSWHGLLNSSAIEQQILHLILVQKLGDEKFPGTRSCTVDWFLWGSHSVELKKYLLRKKASVIYITFQYYTSNEFVLNLIGKIPVGSSQWHFQSYRSSRWIPLLTSRTQLNSPEATCMRNNFSTSTRNEREWIDQRPNLLSVRYEPVVDFFPRTRSLHFKCTKLTQQAILS